MAKINQLKAGTIISYVSLLLGTVVPMVYTPIMLDMLGQNEYGVYSMANTVMSFLSLLNFGIGGTVVRYLTKARVEKGKKEEEKVLGLFMTIYVVIAMIIFIVGMIVAFNVDLFYSQSLNVDELKVLKKLVILMVFNTALFLPLSVFSSVIIAYEKFIANKLISALSIVLAPTLNLVMLFLGFGSVGLVIASTILNLVMCVCNVVYTIKVIGVKPVFKDMPKGMVKDIFSFSAFIFIAELVNSLYWSTDKLLIGGFMGPASVAVYNIGATFNTYLQNFAVAISSVFTPRVNIIAAEKKSIKEVDELIIRVGRIQFIVVSLVLSGFIVFGSYFIRIWAGEGYEKAYIVALMVMLPLLVPLVQSLALSYTVACNMHRFRSIMFLFIAILNVVLTVVMLKIFNTITAAALATCIAYIIGPCIIMNVFYKCKMNLDVFKFWRNILRMMPVPALFSILGTIICNNIALTQWWSLLVAILVYLVAYCISMFFIGMNKYEKDIFTAPIKKILKIH